MKVVWHAGDGAPRFLGLPVRRETLNSIHVIYWTDFLNSLLVLCLRNVFMEFINILLRTINFVSLMFIVGFVDA